MKDLIKEKQLREVLYGLDYIGNKVRNEDAVLTLGRNNCRLLLEEIERLNNIINGLERYLEKIIRDGGTIGSMTFWYRQIYDYLQELKGSDNKC